MQEAKEEVMTVAEVAKLLRVNRKTVEKLIYAGKLHAVKIGWVWRIPRTAVVRFLEGGSTVSLRQLWSWLRFAKMLARGRVGKRWAIRRVKWLWRGRKRRRWW
jgi:excisionase family DNA binding protein